MLNHEVLQIVLKKEGLETKGLYLERHKCILVCPVL